MIDKDIDKVIDIDRRTLKEAQKSEIHQDSSSFRLRDLRTKPQNTLVAQHGTFRA